MEITHDVTIDLLRPRQNVIRVVQEDSTRMIRLKLLSNNQNYNVADDLDEGETLLKFVEFKKADGHGGMYDTTSTGETAVELEDQNVGNVWLVALDGQCFTAPGWTQINVRFETEAGLRIHTFAIMVDVEPTASSDTESTDWGELNSIADLRNAVSTMFEETMSVEAKQALLNLLAHVAYTDEHGQDYYDALEAELFRTAEIVSISAVFDQGSATIYDTDDLDTLRQYLTVTATYEDLSTREITGYTLSGTLTVGTSTITVSYGGKTATFTVTVTAYWDFEWDYTQGKLEELDGFYVDQSSTGISSSMVTEGEKVSQTAASKYFQWLISNTGIHSSLRYMSSGYGTVEVVMSGNFSDSSDDRGRFRFSAAKDSSNRIIVMANAGKWRLRDNATGSSCTPIADFVNNTEYKVRLVLKNTTADVFINDNLVAEDVNISRMVSSDGTNSATATPGYTSGQDYYVLLKAFRIKAGE